MERFVSEMTYNVLVGTLNPTHAQMRIFLADLVPRITCTPPLGSLSPRRGRLSMVFLLQKALMNSRGIRLLRTPGRSRAMTFCGQFA